MIRKLGASLGAVCGSLAGGAGAAGAARAGVAAIRAEAAAVRNLTPIMFAPIVGDHARSRTLVIKVGAVATMIICLLDR
ncbi:hypothetical protein GCM10020258_36340 [Sphingomonas yabuuchiae]